VRQREVKGVTLETTDLLGRRPKRASAPKIAASIVGAEVGAAAGLLIVGGRLFAPLLAAGMAAVLGPLVVVVWRRAHRWYARPWLRAQLRRGPRHDADR
jgi:hypothetical protein